MQQKEYKKNVLISAFNCSPYAGSEQYLGWSSAVATANYGYRNPAPTPTINPLIFP